ncbi:MAG: hypothetical protein ACOCX5_05225 [Chloroflexota bacterium]
MAVKSCNVLFVILAVFLLGMMSAVAQEETTTYTVSFDGIGLTFDASIGERMTVYHEAGTPADQGGPGFADATRTMFEISSMNPSDGQPITATIRVYRTANLAQYDFMQSVGDELMMLFDERPDLAPFYALDARLPYLPILMHGQVIRARAQFIAGENLNGIAYLTAFPAAAEPFLNTSFIYTVQALSSDGTYYISASFPVTVDAFPAEISADFDVDAFSNNIDAYLLESVAILNATEADAFSPSLDVFHAVVESMTFAG